jgi:pantoate--beta-alanine ligase
MTSEFAMHIISDIAALRAQIQQWRRAGETIAFVPTMGNLHQGHLQLVDVAKRHADRVIASIFVNPMQFGAHEDLAKYPRTLADDCAGLAAHGADAVFTPTAEIMYPRGLAAQTAVEVPALGDYFCGASRPGHFRGVATVVTKLFNLVQPDIAVFGKKDYQQLAIIRQLTSDLSLPISIVGVDTERASDGLALSSRNGYLTETQRLQAPLIYQVLCQLKQRWHAGERDITTLVEDGKAALTAGGFTPDYLAFADQQSLVPVTNETLTTLAAAKTLQPALVLLVAAYLGTTRLIDNLEI